MGGPVGPVTARGTAILFHGLLLHGTSNPGPGQRVSCDLRFFPLCGFLPSRVHWLTPTRGALHDALKEATGPTLGCPLEDLALLGECVEDIEPPPHSVLCWPRYLSHLVHGRPAAAFPYLDASSTPTLSGEGPGEFAACYHGRPLQEPLLRSVRRRLAG